MNNTQLAQQLLQKVLKKGVREFCISPGARNAPLVYLLACAQNIKTYYWPEERSAAFFALGLIKATEYPVAVITTSGTAAGELLPAVMEAYYMGLPLLLITADRPRRFRGTGAPQAAEQVGLFGCYVHFTQDIDYLTGEYDLVKWNGQGPAHLNICFEEPERMEFGTIPCLEESDDFIWHPEKFYKEEFDLFEVFINNVQFPLVIVGALNPACRESAIQFLLNLKVPVYAEGTSGIREDPRLAPFRITCIDSIWRLSADCGYPIDGILRLGGIPTARLWRDLEEKKGAVRVCSVSEQPFSGLSWEGVIHGSLQIFFENFLRCKSFENSFSDRWLKTDRAYQQTLMCLFKEEPLAEPSLFHALSKKISQRACIYLGNSLPIREWDLAATFEHRQYLIGASRGLNGIDGQIATFLGFSTLQNANWAILGDLTALYDLVAPWILSQLPHVHVNIVIINNGGGQIFSHKFFHHAFLHAHDLCFESFATFWKLKYEKWYQIPEECNSYVGHRLVEIIPDPQATKRFWAKVEQLR